MQSGNKLSFLWSRRGFQGLLCCNNLHNHRHPYPHVGRAWGGKRTAAQRTGHSTAASDRSRAIAWWKTRISRECRVWCDVSPAFNPSKIGKKQYLKNIYIYIHIYIPIMSLSLSLFLYLSLSLSLSLCLSLSFSLSFSRPNYISIYLSISFST